MDQDSINIDNSENQANKRSWYTARALLEGCRAIRIARQRDVDLYCPLSRAQSLAVKSLRMQANSKAFLHLPRRYSRVLPTRA